MSEKSLANLFFISNKIPHSYLTSGDFYLGNAFTYGVALWRPAPTVAADISAQRHLRHQKGGQSGDQTARRLIYFIRTNSLFHYFFAFPHKDRSANRTDQDDRSGNVTDLDQAFVKGIDDHFLQLVSKGGFA